MSGKFWQDSLNNNVTNVSPVNEEEVRFEVKQVTLIQRVAHWFMKPGRSKTGGAT
jgi:hypothetical protein